MPRCFSPKNVSSVDNLSSCRRWSMYTAGMKKKSQGFTLIELLVVIAIIGILASVILASLSSSRTKARIASAQGTMRSIQTGAAVCINDAAPVAPSEPTETQNGGGGPVCAGNQAAYSTLPVGWIYCDTTAGVQAGPPTPDCGDEVSDFPVDAGGFTIVAESNDDGAIIACTEKGCVTNTDPTENAD